MCKKDFNLKEYLAENKDRHSKNAEIVRKLKAEIYTESDDLYSQCYKCELIFEWRWYQTGVEFETEEL